MSDELYSNLTKRILAKQGTLRVESAFLANCLLDKKMVLAPTIKMNLTEVNMCILNS